MRLEFFVPGIAKTQGSKRAFRTKSGKLIVTDDNPKTKEWRAVVHWYASKAMNRGFLLEGPVRLILTFWRERRKGDYRTSHGKPTKQLRPSADAFPIPKPDSLKLGRAVEDSLAGVVLCNDSQVCDHFIFKRYCKNGQQPGVNIVVETMDNTLQGEDYFNDEENRKEENLFEAARS